jgi:hypothetical protein
VAGTKHWVVREPAVDTPLRRHVSDHEAAAARPVLFEVDLAPGDALYLPRGVVHSATAQEGVSLHITVGVLATTVHDVLQALVEQAGDDPAFRRSLTAGWAFDDGAATAAVKSAVADMVDWLGRVDAAQVAGRLRDRFVSRRTPLLDGQLLEVVGLDRLDDDSVVVRRAGIVATLTVEGAEPEDRSGLLGASDGGTPGRGPSVCLTLGDRRVELPAPLEPAVRRLLDGSPHRVGELADLLDHPSRLVLVRRLVREGALRTRGPGADA